MRRTSQETIDRIRELRKTGMSIRFVALEIGVSPFVVQTYAEKSGRVERCSACDVSGHRRNHCPNPVYPSQKNNVAAAYRRRHIAAGVCGNCPRPATRGTFCDRCAASAWGKPSMSSRMETT